MLAKGSVETWRLWGRSREEETLGEFSLLCESGSRAPLLVIGHWLCQEHSRTRAPLALWNYYLSRQELKERIFTENNLKSPQVILQISCSARCPQAILSFPPSELFHQIPVASSGLCPPGTPSFTQKASLHLGDLHMGGSQPWKPSLCLQGSYAAPLNMGTALPQGTLMQRAGK